jgi:hypothetical protein
LACLVKNSKITNVSSDQAPVSLGREAIICSEYYCALGIKFIVHETIFSCEYHCARRSQLL